jgi:hypothetical protein
MIYDSIGDVEYYFDIRIFKMFCDRLDLFSDVHEYGPFLSLFLVGEYEVCYVLIDDFSVWF